MEQLPLVFFTVLAQAAAGLAFVLCGLKLVEGKRNDKDFFTKGYAAVLVVITIAGIASLTHLGQPFRAMNVLAGLRHGSPLSFEIISVSMFAGVAGFVAFLNYKKFERANDALLSVLAAAVGFVMVIMISRVYNIPTVDAWHSPLTVIQFLTTAIVLGFISASALYADGEEKGMFLTLGSAVAIAVVLMQLPVTFYFYGGLTAMAQSHDNTGLPMARFFLLGVGVAVWIASLVLKKRVNLLHYAALSLILCSELAGRVYFYDLLNLRTL